MLTWYVNYDTPEGKLGITKRQHLSQAGVTVEDPEVHPACAHVLGWYWELEGSRTGTGFGINPITYTEILSWSQLTGNILCEWEVQAIKRLDATKMTLLAKKKG